MTQEPAEPDPPPPADDSPLEHVIDDDEPRMVWGEWAVQEMTRGRSAEEVTEELVANGWDHEDAEILAEQARIQTRHLRGVRTRDDVAWENERSYRKSMGIRWFIAFLDIAAARRLLYSISYLLTSRRPRRSDKSESDQSNEREKPRR